MLMRIPMIVLALGGLMAAGCFTYSAPPPPPTTMSAWGPTGGFTLNSGGTCNGQVSLVNGSATVSDPCFTSSYDVVLCSDNTAANPVRCTSSPGSLLLSGTGSDLVAYARVK